MRIVLLWPFLIALSSLLLVACVQPTPAPTSTVNRIAYIGPEGALYTVNPDGSDQERLSSGVTVGLDGGTQVQEGQYQKAVFYAWPTWSPDGQHLAVSGVTVEGPSSISVGLFSITVATGAATQLYENPAGITPLIAPGIPHYMYWSPDSKHLAFLAQSSQGLTLFISPAGDPPGLDTIVSGAPLYLVWAANSRSLLLHVGEGMFLSDINASKELRELRVESFAFRTPAWSPGGERIAYVDQVPQGGNALFVADADGENSHPIAQVGEKIAFLWSPNHDSIALLDTDDLFDLFYKTLKVVELDNRTVRTLTTESVLAFFWSPNGEKIAYVALDPLARHWSLKVVDLQGKPRKLVDFIPSNALLFLMSFFDQYAYSNSLWSPDSRQLVLTGQLIPESDGSDRVPDGNQVYVIDVENSAAPNVIAEGSIAFWSWN